MRHIQEPRGKENVAESSRLLASLLIPVSQMGVLEVDQQARPVISETKIRGELHFMHALVAAANATDLAGRALSEAAPCTT
jgi:hypothetical protein